MDNGRKYAAAGYFRPSLSREILERLQFGEVVE